MIVYLIPIDSPFVGVRYVSFVFVVFLPGYCLVNILFIGKNKIDVVEKIVLSVALSFALVGLDGMFLGLSSVGMTFESISISLGILVVVLATVAFVRKSREKLPDMQVPQQISA